MKPDRGEHVTGATTSTELPDSHGGDPPAFATAFDGGSHHGIQPYVRLMPPDADKDAGDGAGIAMGTSVARSTGATFHPEDIEGREYRLLAGALANGDPDTDHRAAMTLVQLVKFLRAAGVSVPNFPATGMVADPGMSPVGPPHADS